MFRPSITRWQTLEYLWPSQAPYAYAWSRPTVFIDPMGSTPTKAVTRRSSHQDRLDSAQSDDCTAVAWLILSSSGGFDPAVLARYNACVANQGCPDVDQSTLRCIYGNICQGNATISLSTDHILCGHSEWGGIGCPKITLYTNMLDSLDCNHFGSGAPYHTVLIHEALHTCGISHPKNVTGDNSCNNIISCCMLRASGYLPSWQTCTAMISHPG